MDNSKEPCPNVWKEGQLCYQSGLTLEIAEKMLSAAQKEAVKQEVPVSIAITDSGGNLVAFHRMDNAALFSIQIAMNKAFTCVYGKLPTQVWRDVIHSGVLTPLYYHENWIAFPGGFPIVKDNKLFGGIGISGGTYQDTFIARAALAAGGFSVDDTDNVIKEMNT